MSFLDRIVNAISPPKKEQTPAEAREEYMMRRYHLVKDATEPFTYWVNEIQFIRFDPADPASVQAAEDQIIEHYKNPKIQSASRDQRMRKQVEKSPRKTKGAGKDLSDLGDGFGRMTDWFMQEPKKEKR